MRSFKLFLVEYLTDKQRELYADIRMTKKARSDTDHFFGVDNDKVVQDLDNHHLIHSDKSEVHNAVERHLGVNIDPADYKKGRIPHPRNPQNITKIGTLIKDQNLLNSFNTDNTREGAKAIKNMSVSIVRGTEVAGQTNPSPDSLHPTGHSWGELSCKNIETGSKRDYLKAEIKHGTVVMFGHDHDNREIYRATLHPYHNSNGKVAYAIDSEYGIKHPAFTAHANKIAGQLSAPIDTADLIHTKNVHVYDDPFTIDTILHAEASVDEHISKSLEDKSASVREAAIRHPKATAEHISKALQDEDASVREAAIRHPKATAEHIGQALKDKDVLVRRSAMMHPNATVGHISRALQDQNYIVRYTAMTHPKATAEHISKALQDEYSNGVRHAAISHANATAEHIGQALKDEHPSVRMAAITHPKATAEHIGEGLKDKDWFVRQAAQQQLNSLPK